jgi:N-acetylglucosamine malate deacetylase 1
LIDNILRSKRIILSLLKDNQTISVFMAHPDDEALLCYGSLKKFQLGGAKIHITFLTNGGQARDIVTPNVAKSLSANYKILDFPVSNLSMNKNLVTSIEKQIDMIRPSMLITHTNSLLEHQDHQIVSKASTLAGFRSKYVNTILHCEPVLRNTGFSPNLFIDIEKYISDKLQAITLYRNVLDRWYMHPEIVTTRARSWALQVQNDSSSLGYCEAFEIHLLRY